MWGERAAGIGVVAVTAVQAMRSVHALLAVRARKEDWIPAEDAGMTEGGWSRDGRTMVVDVATRRKGRRNSE